MKKTIQTIILALLIVIVIPTFISLNFLFNKKDEGDYTDIIISVYNVEKNKIEKLKMDDYLLGVVAAEMPASFELEALKAQAIAARTYSYARFKGKFSDKYSYSKHFSADVCTDSKHCQAWMTDEKMKIMWDNNYKKYTKKIQKAVKSTNGLIIVYENEIINPLYHANSGGITEDVKEVWNSYDIPYLRSVFSKGEDQYSQYSDVVEIDIDDFIKTIKNKYSQFEIDLSDKENTIKVLEYNDSQRIGLIKIGNTHIEGTQMREIFNLNSTNFTLDLNLEQNKVTFTTKGWGHGVGMSQCGAAQMALDGKLYDEILKHYYTGVEIIKIKE